MNERIIDGRPLLPPAEERPSLPPPESGEESESREDSENAPFWKSRKLWLALLALALLGALAYLLLGNGDEGSGGGGRPPATVSATEAEVRVWGGELTAIGTAEAIQGVEVTTEVPGQVTAIAFRNGTYARAGALLVRLDTTSEQAERAALAAQAERARLAFERAKRLIERGAIAEAEVEAARADWRNLAAQVQQVATVIEKKRIDAPFSGLLGIRQVSLGQYVSPGSPIVSLQQVSPIYVNFPVPERAFPQIREGLEVSMTAEAFGGRTFSGRITAIDPGIAQDTRSFTVQVTVPNRDGALRPGMFADVSVNLAQSREVVVVPTTAIARNAYGDLVYVVERLSAEEVRQRRQQRSETGDGEDGWLFGLFGGDEEGGKQGGGQGGGAESQLVVRAVFVEPGETRGLYTEVDTIKPGTRVVTAGQLKIEDGASIRVVERDALEGAQRRPDNP